MFWGPRIPLDEVCAVGLDAVMAPPLRSGRTSSRPAALWLVNPRHLCSLLNVDY
jgi:hypothetical protein